MRFSKRNMLFLAIASVTLACVIIIISPHRSRQNGIVSKCLVCYAELRHLGQIMIEDNPDPAGQTPEVLVKNLLIQGAIVQKNTSCPISGEQYLFAPLSITSWDSLDSQTILIYEPPALHENGKSNIFFGDGQCRSVMEDEYYELMKANNIEIEIGE